MNGMKIKGQLLVVNQEGLDDNSEKFVKTFDSSLLDVKFVNNRFFSETKISEKLKAVKGIILVVDVEKETTIETCATILNIRMLTNAPIWLKTSVAYTSIEREVFLNIGIDGFFYEDYSMKEIELTVLNLLKRMNSLKEEEDTTPNKPSSFSPMSAKRDIKKDRYNRNIHHYSNEKEVKEKNVSISLDGATKTMIFDKTNVPLSNKQYQLAVLFLENKNEVVGYEKIYTTIWNGPYDIDKKNMVGSIVAQLRNKLERYQVQTKFIYNVPNKGYRFVVQES
ncbi:winged helix-turn-helix domain-containing protein [Vagococcus carniphilus]|uniref:winged helix-turn-helix domain-containing protein n=1 Tax=Vagococcus carniphilus TaxID=218144 RepID=UPI00289151C1|nr:winged helix-turn-helix domain-containing protein [Vagococcus carniphilus]MDT2830250.1 winged helix-turn-helix domain-containing protein [Vagococcus carniphilus]MDT2838682.1 winged helix-turn-helix domain-containing protein [Vagococcus carniphilus]MDT2853520.1 winged helix-turn-helix domain-containing protein [Vagococcus carniphilus]